MHASRHKHLAAIALWGALVAWPATAAAPASTGIKLPALFKPSPLQVLHVFGKAAQSGSLDGIYPEAGLVLASDGRFYGTTAAGGVYGYDPTIQTYGEGTVFSIDTQGHYTQVYSFHHVNADGVFSNVDGREPNRGLIEGADGAL